MARKESLKKENLKNESEAPTKPSFISGKAAVIYNAAFGIIKFFLGLCLLPFVYSVSAAFMNEFGLIEGPLQFSFWAGVVTLLLIYLFVWEPVIIYSKGHRLLEIIFSFFQPLVKVAPFLLPIYTIVFFIGYSVLSAFIKEAWLLKYSIFIFGFTIALHLIFSAKTMRSKKGDFLKGNYIFGFSFVYILNIGFLALALSFIFGKFSFVNFSNVSLQTAKGIFSAVFKQLFVPV